MVLCRYSVAALRSTFVITVYGGTKYLHDLSDCVGRCQLFQENCFFMSVQQGLWAVELKHILFN
jgi:hypothetical protein